MIPLSQREGEPQEFAICSPEDVEELSKYTWHKSTTGYVKGYVNGNPCSMHVFVKTVLEKEIIPDGLCG
jgi:hypothetical protein